MIEKVCDSRFCALTQEDIDIWIRVWARCTSFAVPYNVDSFETRDYADMLARVDANTLGGHPHDAP